MELTSQRPLLNKISEGRERLEEALDAEKRALIHTNEKRLLTYMEDSKEWLVIWPDIQKKIIGSNVTKLFESVL